MLGLIFFQGNIVSSLLIAHCGGKARERFLPEGWSLITLLLLKFLWEDGWMCVCVHVGMRMSERAKNVFHNSHIVKYHLAKMSHCFSLGVSCVAIAIFRCTSSNCQDVVSA